MRAVPDEEGIAYSLYDLGHLAYIQGDLAQAESFLEDSRTRFQERGNKLALGRVLLSLGYVTREQGRPEQATVYYKASLAEHARKEH